MTKQIQNEMSDAQLDAVSGGSWSRECSGYKKRDNECGYKQKKHCGAEPPKYYDDCRPAYRPNRDA
jgi:hypothetical protein